MQSYAQFETDLALASLYPADYVGTYVDIGAADPTLDSNTFLFYQRGWRGYACDPASTAEELWREYRPEDRFFPVAISDHAGTISYFESEVRGWSTVDSKEASIMGCRMNRREVTCISVRDLTVIPGIAWEPRPWEARIIEGPDILSVDVEGHERSVLMGCPLKTWRPRHIVLEACYPRTDNPCRHLWVDLLEDAGYRLVKTVAINEIYAREDASCFG